MSEDMLMCFDSPLNPPRVVSRTLGMKSPLIPCPTLPFDMLAEKIALEADPFENVLKTALNQTPVKAKAVSLPGSPTSPKHVRELPQDSELDISAALTGRSLVSSTPNFARALHSKGPPVSPLVDTPGTPTRRQHSSQGSPSVIPRRSVMSGVMEMSADHLRTIIQKKMERLKALNQNLSSVGRSNLRRSLSTSDLPKGSRAQPLSMELLNASQVCEVNDATFNKHSSMLTQRSQGDITMDSTPIKISALKKEALKISSIFQNITVDLDDGSDDTLDTPIKEKTMRRYSKSFAGKCPESPEDLLTERPPWDWSGSSSEDEDGLPKIMRLRVPSTKKGSHHSPDTISILTRYRKTRSSLQFDDDKESEVCASQSSHTDHQALKECTNTTVTASVSLPSAQETMVIQPPPIPEIHIGELKPRTATTSIVKKGPLKAMMPLPNMMKAVMPPSTQDPNNKTSIKGLRGRDKSMLGQLGRSSSSSALMHKLPNPTKPPSPKQNTTTHLKQPIKIDERPASAPSPCKGVQKDFSAPAAKGKPSLMKKRPTVALGKENLIKK